MWKMMLERAERGGVGIVVCHIEGRRHDGGGGGDNQRRLKGPRHTTSVTEDTNINGAKV